MCAELFKIASKKMDCPILLWPKCHPSAHLDVYVDARRHKIVLCCSQCDKPITDINPILPRPRAKRKSPGS